MSCYPQSTCRYSDKAGGSIDVATAPGEFTEFSIVLPRGGQTGG